MNRYCLDTSAYSQFKRGNELVVGLIDSAEWIGVPSVVIGELLTGFFQGDRGGHGKRGDKGGHGDRCERNESELAGFLSNPVVEELRVDHTVARLYAEIVISLRSRGTPLPTNDIWIGACAVRSGSTVLTFDEHFRSIERVGALVLG